MVRLTRSTAIQVLTVLGLAVVASGFCVRYASRFSVGSHQPSPSSPAGSIGAAIRTFVPTTEQIRRYREIARSIDSYGEHHPDFRIDLDFWYDSALTSEASRIEQVPPLAAALRAGGLTPSEFVLVHAVIGALRCEQLIESMPSTAASERSLAECPRLTPAQRNFFLRNPEAQSLVDTLAPNVN